MNKADSEEDSNKDGIDNNNCRLCELQTFEMLFDKSADSKNKTENCPCFVNTVITYLHEQILGCNENDRSTKPRAALSFNNEFFKSQKIMDLREKHSSLINTVTDLTASSKKPLYEFKPVSTVNFVSIETEEELNVMLDDLLKCCEISVNLEYYSLRCYLGFTWLLQISTTQTNYFVNCLRLESQLHILNEVFLNNKILKIFYKGKDSIVRMQKDFGIFVTNIFDFYIIEKNLLLSQEVELVKNDVFSFLDPRHTYLLLYIKNYIINLLLELEIRNPFKSVRKHCRKMCNQIYRTPEWNDESVLQNLGSTKATYQEIFIIQQLLIWRNEIAKNEDVSVNLILPDSKIVDCAKEFLQNSYSDTFNKYCNTEFVKNGIVELNTNEIIETAMKYYGIKKRHIVNCLNGIDKSWKNMSQQLVEQKSQLSIKTSTKSQIFTKSLEEPENNIKLRSFAPIDEDANDFKILEKEVGQQQKYLRIRIEFERTHLLFSLATLKPQLRFKEIIDNSSRIWKPAIKEKPNRLVPLHLHIVKYGSKSRYCHPYKIELKHFNVPQSQLVGKMPIPDRKIEETPLYVIKTSEDLVNLANELENHSEIAVDLKYNRERSYLGYTSLLTISTRNSDYIIDALLLRSSLRILNNIFTNPKILKVFHNSVNKLLWMQKDFSLYVVNMFDVARTDMVFTRKIHSLTYLKCDICDIKLKKLSEIELSKAEKDWRIRNLSFRVKQYLRHGTHHLLYIKDILSNELSITGNLLKRYYDYCTDLCKYVYRKPFFDPNSYKNILNKKDVKNKYAGHVIRIEVLKELNRLRYMIAKREDENPNYILSEEVLLKLVDSLSHDEQQILNLWDYEKKRMYASKVCRIMYSAKNIRVKTENDDDYHYIYESENDLNEMMEQELGDENGTTYNRRRSTITLGDFICYDKSDETITDNFMYTNDTTVKSYTDKNDRSFMLIKGDRWNESRNIGDWLKKWIGKRWSGKFYVRKVSDEVFFIALEFKKYKDIIWNKRNQIHYEEGAFIQNSLSCQDRETQRILSNIAKDLRSKGRQVKIRELTIKIEDKWYEWRLDSLQEISEETVRMRGVDTDI